MDIHAAFLRKAKLSPVLAAFQRGTAFKGNVLCVYLLWLYNSIEKISLLWGLHPQAVLELCFMLLWSTTVCDGGTLTADRTRSHICKVQQTPAKGSIYKNAATSTAIFLVHLCLNCFTSVDLPQFVLLNATQKSVSLFSFWHLEVIFFSFTQMQIQTKGISFS